VSNYVKATNFATKDALLTGNPAKIIKGTEIDDEFNAIAVAVSTKADLASPTFTGVPTAPTAGAGTNNTQLATTAFVVTTANNINQRNINVLDYGANGNGVFDNTTAFSNTKTAADSQNKNILVPSGNFINGKPSSITGKNVLWTYYDGGDADNVLTSAGDRGGFFADYDCKATEVKIAQINENQASISGGGFRDVTFFNAVDTDTTNYTAIGQKVTHGIRSFVQGSYSGSAYNAQYKDLVGGFFAALGNIAWDARGVSAVTADAVQLGSGIASNEFAVNNPSSAGGSAAQSKSMAAIQAIVRSRYADEDATHISRCVYVENNGERITAGIQFISNTADGFTSHFKYGILMSGATVTAAAIVMPASSSGNVGTFIEYDSNDYSFYDRTDNRFGWVVGGSVGFYVGATGVGIAAPPTTKTRLFIDGSTTALSHLLLFPGATPSSPGDGELWFDGTNVKIQVSGVTKTFTLT
jgi:hypothetical protein